MAQSYRIISVLLLCVLFASFAPTAAQSNLYAPCGVVDQIDYPLDISETLEERYDDFALYRARFGGLHTGLDLAFNRLHEPVYAAARGRVTYADPEGWDTEKGVVIIEHIFPDGSKSYTLYGHMEQTETILFPRVDSCVERGDIVGAVGRPSLGRPHLHYEIRSFMPGNGGPGYVTSNPTVLGWYHPLDFTSLWRLRLAPGYIGSITFTEVPSLPPIILDSGVFVIASGSALQGFAAPNTSLWRVTADGVITGMVGLPGDRVVARTRSGQMLLLQGGRYASVWSVSGPEAPLIALGESVLVVTDGGGIAAYTPTGEILWEALPQTTVVSAGADAVPPRVERFEANGSAVAIAMRSSDEVDWRLLDSSGAPLYHTTFEDALAFAPLPTGGWLALDDAALYRLDGNEREEVAAITPTPRSLAQMVADATGAAYIYAGDPNAALLAVDSTGELRWRVEYPQPLVVLPPVMAVGSSCLLYTLDADGTLNVFSTLDGALLSQRQIYAGGARSSSARARVLQVDPYERLIVGGGFLTTAALDGRALAGEAIPDCPTP
jgi:hypothetical protein